VACLWPFNSNCHFCWSHISYCSNCLLVMACRTHFQNFFVCSNIKVGSSDM
jgi:hypothetical protein